MTETWHAAAAAAALRCPHCGTKRCHVCGYCLAAHPAKPCVPHAAAVILVWRDERGNEICRSTPVTPGTRKAGIPLDAQHCDVITAEGSDS